jgi:hypothetical protein
MEALGLEKLGGGMRRTKKGKPPGLISIPARGLPQEQTIRDRTEVGTPAILKRSAFQEL